MALGTFSNKTKNGEPVETPKYDPRKYTAKEILAFEKRDKEEAEKQAK